jgi:Concanavalin A-like lectin/glucanases superfamily
MSISRCTPQPCCWRSLVFACALLFCARSSAETGLLFNVSADKSATADFSAGGTPEPTFLSEVTVIPDGAKGSALSCGNVQRLAWKAPGNIQAQRGTLSFFWRSRYPVGPTEFPIFRVGYADHSSWDMVWLRIDYNGHGFDAFVTDASLARTRVSVDLPEFPKPSMWVHLALAWDETSGIRFYVNGKLAAKQETIAVYNAALDQFGPHSRIISPYNVQSDYNFVRGGDIDEIRIYDRMLEDAAVAQLARAEAPSDLPPLPSRDLTNAKWRDEWWLRYGWNREDDQPPALPAAKVSVRKVEIHDAYDLKRWWWKANDGIRETTWPGVYNRSRLPGRHDYFTLPDWDCYSLSGKAITFAMPEEPWNHLEISGAAWGKMELLPAGTANEMASEAQDGTLLFERKKGEEKTVHTLASSLVGRKIRFTNVEQEEPIDELSAYNVTQGIEPTGSHAIALQLTARAEVDSPGLSRLQDFIKGRYPADERSSMLALPAGSVNIPVASPTGKWPGKPRALPLVHVLIPDSWDELTDGLDGIAIDLPALKVQPMQGDFLPLNIRVKDPLWPLRDMFDFTFKVKVGEAHTLWIDLRDRLLPPGKGLYLAIAAAGADFGAESLEGAAIRLIFKPRQAARAEHEVDRFTQARDSYAMLVEEHPFSPKFDLWVRFETDLKDLLRVNPGHVLGHQYAAMAMGAPRPTFQQLETPAGVPLWAFRQVEVLKRIEHFVNWWIDHRQIANGEFGGGISDDTDLTNLWPGVALMGCQPDKLSDSIQRLLDAAFTNKMFTNGLSTIQTDELHSYEEGINCLGQNLILSYGSPRQIERAMETSRGIESITGINAAGHRHIRSSYFSGTRIAEDEPWNYAKAFSYLMLQPAQLLVDYNGNPKAKKVLLELADGLLAHRHQDAKGVYVLPSAINFKTDANSDATRRYLPWPLLWSSWKWTSDQRYLQPIFDGGTTALMAINANVFDLLAVRETWGAKILGGERGLPTEGKAAVADGRGSPKPSTDRSTQGGHFNWQLSGRKAALESLYAGQIEEMALGDFINTEGSLWSDRVGVPTTELQRARLGGVALARNATFPGHVVSWKFHAPATAENMAILMPDATATGFKVIAYNLSATPVQAAMTGWNIDPGLWEIAQGVDANDDDVADQMPETRTAVFERTRSVELTFAPRVITVLTFKLKTPATPYWQRPDLGIDPEDVVVQGREVHVTVHSLGSVPSAATEVVLRDNGGKVLTTGKLSALAAPTDLLPKTGQVILLLPAGAQYAGSAVEIDPGHKLEEITTLNNVVKF